MTPSLLPGALLAVLFLLAEMLGAISLLGGVGSALVHGHFRSWRATVWLSIGVVGLPAMLFSFAYLVGSPIALLVFAVCAVGARWPNATRSFVATCVIASTSVLAWSAEVRGFDELGLYAFLAISAACAIAATGRLGVTFGRDVLWASRLGGVEPTERSRLSLDT